jgi:hypothetical protein
MRRKHAFIADGDAATPVSQYSPMFPGGASTDNDQAFAVTNSDLQGEDTTGGSNQNGCSLAKYRKTTLVERRVASDEDAAAACVRLHKPFAFDQNVISELDCSARQRAQLQQSFRVHRSVLGHVEFNSRRMCKLLRRQDTGVKIHSVLQTVDILPL